MKETK
jgi:hypothetical protein